MNTPAPNIYDAYNAAILCNWSATAYTPLSDAIIDRVSDTAVTVGSAAPDDDVVSFRGTIDLRNWLTDLDCAFVKTDIIGESGAGRIHRGFFRALNAVFDPITRELIRRDKPRIWVTGHSLGGALASLFGQWAAQTGFPIAGIYTFGQPRVGNANFCRCFDSGLRERTFLVVHERDIVPHVPWLLGRYRHAGHEIHYSSAEASPVMDRSCWRYAAADMAALAQIWLSPSRVETWLADHHVSRYLALFRA